MKRIKYIILFLIVVLLAGCDYQYASTTREIRHSGFSLSSFKFKCSSIYTDEEVVDKPLYYIGNYIITESGLLYETNLGKPYSNKMNCKKPNFTEKISAIFDMKVVKTEDGSYYYLSGSDQVPAYSLVPESDEDYALYDILLKESSVLKVVTVNSKGGIYYVLKNDGNIYQYNVILENDEYLLDTTDMVYSYTEFGSKIKDFNYNGSNSTTYIKTETTYYRMLITNLEKCSSYVDVACDYKLKLDEGLKNSYDRILAYNGSTLITTYGKIFNVNN